MMHWEEEATAARAGGHGAAVPRKRGLRRAGSPCSQLFTAKRCAPLLDGVRAAGSPAAGWLICRFALSSASLVLQCSSMTDKPEPTAPLQPPANRTDVTPEPIGTMVMIIGATGKGTKPG